MLLAYGFADQGSIAGYVETQLAHMHHLAVSRKLTPAKRPQITLMLWGHYRDHKLTALESWQQVRRQVEDRVWHRPRLQGGEGRLRLRSQCRGRHTISQAGSRTTLLMAMPAPYPPPFAEECPLSCVAMTCARKQARLYTTLAKPSRFLKASREKLYQDRVHRQQAAWNLALKTAVGPCSCGQALKGTSTDAAAFSLVTSSERLTKLRPRQLSRDHKPSGYRLALRRATSARCASEA